MHQPHIHRLVLEKRKHDAASRYGGGEDTPVFAMGRLGTPLESLLKKHSDLVISLNPSLDCGGPSRDPLPCSTSRLTLISLPRCKSFSFIIFKREN